VSTSTGPHQVGAAIDQAALQRRTVRVLVLTQAVGAVGITIGIATASLLARDISGSESQAGLAQTSQVLGAAVAAYLLARVMARRGRRVGLATGYLLGAAGAVLAVLAGAVGSMPLLLLGALLLGSTTAANSGARYAATDLAEAHHRGRALSVVVWATTIGAVAGPRLGWSFGTVAASTLIADHAPLDARADVQGVADLVMNLGAAVAGGLAGVVVGAFGYGTLSHGSLALALLVVVAAVLARTGRERLAQ